MVLVQVEQAQPGLRLESARDFRDGRNDTTTPGLSIQKYWRRRGGGSEVDSAVIEGLVMRVGRRGGMAVRVLQRGAPEPIRGNRHGLDST